MNSNNSLPQQVRILCKSTFDNDLLFQSCKLRLRLQGKLSKQPVNILFDPEIGGNSLLRNVGSVYETIRRDVPEDCTFYSHSGENIRSDTLYLLSRKSLPISAVPESQLG